MNRTPAKRRASEEDDDYEPPAKRHATDVEQDDEDEDPPTKRKKIGTPKKIVTLKISKQLEKVASEDEENINVAQRQDIDVVANVDQRRDSTTASNEVKAAPATSGGTGDIVHQIQGLATQLGDQLLAKDAEIEKLKGACIRRYNEKKVALQELEETRQQLQLQTKTAAPTEKAASVQRSAATDAKATAEKADLTVKVGELETEVDRLKGVLRKKKGLVDDAIKVLFAEQQKQKLVTAAEKVVARWHGDGEWQVFEGAIRELKMVTEGILRGGSGGLEEQSGYLEEGVDAKDKS